MLLPCLNVGQEKWNAISRPTCPLHPQIAFNCSELSGSVWKKWKNTFRARIDLSPHMDGAGSSHAAHHHQAVMNWMQWNRIEFMQIWQNLSKTHIYAESAWPALLLIPTLVSTFLLDTFALIPSNVVLGRWCWYWYKAGENSKKYDPSSRQTLISHYPEQSFNFNFNIKPFDLDRCMGLIEIYYGLNWVIGSRKGQILYLYKNSATAVFEAKKISKKKWNMPHLLIRNKSLLTHKIV